MNEGFKFDPRKLWFLPLRRPDDPAELGLRIHIPDYDKKNENSALAGCYQLLDTILGEKAAALEIQHIEVEKLPAIPEEEEGLIEMFELPKYISWSKR